jgi:hypothetical protein
VPQYFSDDDQFSSLSPAIEPLLHIASAIELAVLADSVSQFVKS